MNYTSWPFQEAQRLLSRTKDKDVVIFQTGYGPSGLPHIGTFGEVARTTMVMNAFRQLSDKPMTLYVFSDDMDALRKAPTNVPNQDMLNAHVGVPLTSVPDPFGTHDSFASHNNAELCKFLDSYGFDYEFKSATEEYQNGVFNDALTHVVENMEKILQVILPTLGKDRQETYCPFLPIRDGIMYMKIRDWSIKVVDGELCLLWWDVDNFYDQSVPFVTPIHNGHCKLQWKVDWAMRWMAYGVDYEMYGKDLIESAKIGDIFCKRLGYKPPNHMMYELFLDEEGRKISKSIGNGIDINVWWKYGTRQALSYYMFQNPRKARKLHFGVVPQMMDDYLKQLETFQSDRDNYDNAVWHVHSGNVPTTVSPISFSMLLNLVSITNTNDPEVILRYVQNHKENVTLETHPILGELIQRSINFYEDHVLPHKEYRDATADEKIALIDLVNAIESADGDEERLTYEIYESGKRSYGPKNLRSFFQMVYEVLMGQKSGPRLPVFVMLYGIDNTIKLIKEKI